MTNLFVEVRIFLLKWRDECVNDVTLLFVAIIHLRNLYRYWEKKSIFAGYAINVICQSKRMHTTKSYGGVDVWIHLFVICALGANESCHLRFPKASPTPSRGHSSSYPRNWSSSDFQCQSGCFGEKSFLIFCQKSNHDSSDAKPLSLVIKPTNLTKFPVRIFSHKSVHTVVIIISNI